MAIIRLLDDPRYLPIPSVSIADIGKDVTIGLSLTAATWALCPESAGQLKRERPAAIHVRHEHVPDHGSGGLVGQPVSLTAAWSSTSTGDHIITPGAGHVSLRMATNHRDQPRAELIARPNKMHKRCTRLNSLLADLGESPLPERDYLPVRAA